MANIGKNKGRRLQRAIQTFSAMLIKEAVEIGNKTYEQLDVEFDFCLGQCSLYSRCRSSKKKRSPKAVDLQDLENKVAKLLMRPAHKIVPEYIGLDKNEQSQTGLFTVIGELNEKENFRKYEQSELSLMYEHDWPTYRRLSLRGPTLVVIYAWQWGILYDQNRLPEPFATVYKGVSSKQALETVIPEKMEKIIRKRVQYNLAYKAMLDALHIAIPNMTSAQRSFAIETLTAQFAE